MIESYATTTTYMSYDKEEISTMHFYVEHILFFSFLLLSPSREHLHNIVHNISCTDHNIRITVHNSTQFCSFL